MTLRSGRSPRQESFSAIGSSSKQMDTSTPRSPLPFSGIRAAWVRNIRNSPQRTLYGETGETGTASVSWGNWDSLSFLVIRMGVGP